MTSQKHALITGVGPGTGSALVRRFAKAGYKISMLARNSDRLRRLEVEAPQSAGYPTDVTETTSLNATLDLICAEHGDPDIVIHNAVGGSFGTFAEIDPFAFQAHFDVNVMAFLHLARRLVPAMVNIGRGTLIASGNTAAWRGKPRFAAYAPTKAAQRILAESMARELGPKGVHVAYITIDAAIDSERTRKLQPDASSDYFMQPDDIADEIYHVAHQPRGAWSFNVEIRPFSETW